MKKIDKFAYELYKEYQKVYNYGQAQTWDKLSRSLQLTFRCKAELAIKALKNLKEVLKNDSGIDDSGENIQVRSGAQSTESSREVQKPSWP